MSTAEDFLLFFERPAEPCFMQKGADNAFFQIPDHFYPTKYKPVIEAITNRSGGATSRAGGGDTRPIPLKKIQLPDLSRPLSIEYQGNFSLFLTPHKELAACFIKTLMEIEDLNELAAVCTYCQIHMNPYLFNYCLSVCLLHRPDTKGLSLPTYAEIFPHKFMDPKVLFRAREMADSAPDPSKRKPVVIPVNHTASDLEPEQRVAYFREDIGVNLHHWHWHLVYPTMVDGTPELELAIVNKDRRGELFYYMHQQIIARFDAERLCNKLPRVLPLEDLNEPIKEAYFPKLNNTIASRHHPPRFANSKLQDIERSQDMIKLDVYDMATYRRRYIEAVNNMAVRLPDGSLHPLTEESGIDVLGNMIEAVNALSPNFPYYNSYHGNGHIMLSLLHDPDYRHLEAGGVMGDVSTAMRDPVFYRWHKHIDDLFQLYKDKLTPYAPETLEFKGISCRSIRVEGPAGAALSTMWERTTLDVSRGLDFAKQGSMPAIYTHLQHEEFDYIIEVENSGGEARTGTVRIFLAPAQDAEGCALPLDTQRRLMIELDKFTKKLEPGNNIIKRKSVDSSVTIPHERSFRPLKASSGTPNSDPAFDFCGCGWPHHMLIPKGTAEGYPVVLFCMISDWKDDKVEQNLVGTCSDAASYCGIRDRKYPDRRAMGYPFDRPLLENCLSDFLTPNMATTNITIIHTDKTRDRVQK